MHDYEAGQEMIQDYKNNMKMTNMNIPPSQSQIVAHLNFNSRDSFRESNTQFGSLNVSAYDSPDIGRRGTRLIPANQRHKLDMSADQGVPFMQQANNNSLTSGILKGGMNQNKAGFSIGQQ